MRATALTIAGSDPSGGAGIQADLKTFAAHGVYGAAVIAALTVQDTRGVREVREVPADFVAAQLEAVLADLRPAAVKTGMLLRADVVEVVARKLKEHAVPRLVVDPVMISTSGARLLEEDAVEAMKRELFPLATLVTPNAGEAEVLSGVKVVDLPSADKAAMGIAALGPRAVLVKGGHFTIEPGWATDHFVSQSDFVDIRGPRSAITDLHGAGCALAAAITARLALGEDLLGAVRRAKRWLTEAIEGAERPGRGRRVPFYDGPNPFDVPPPVY
jgi:hydroxymethylpyrimidine/phosphomethylpyrimidine kinase